MNGGTRKKIRREVNERINFSMNEAIVSLTNANLFKRIAYAFRIICKIKKPLRFRKRL